MDQRVWLGAAFFSLNITMLSCHHEYNLQSRDVTRPKVDCFYVTCIRKEKKQLRPTYVFSPMKSFTQQKKNPPQRSSIIAVPSPSSKSPPAVVLTRHHPLTLLLIPLLSTASPVLLLKQNNSVHPLSPTRPIPHAQVHASATPQHHEINILVTISPDDELTC